MQSFLRTASKRWCLFPCDWNLWLTNVLLCISASTLDKLKIWQRQILSRILEGRKKFCQSSASGPFVCNFLLLFFLSPSLSAWPIFHSVFSRLKLAVKKTLRVKNDRILQGLLTKIIMPNRWEADQLAIYLSIRTFDCNLQKILQ